MTSTAFGATKTATVNGTTLAYREEGEGEPVVFVHGGESDLRTWEQQLPAVGRSYRAITYSRRFARPNEDIDLEAEDPWLPHVDDLAAKVCEEIVSPAVVQSTKGQIEPDLTVSPLRLVLVEKGVQLSTHSL